MYFTLKRYRFSAFDGKTILSAHLDYPFDGKGARFNFFLSYADKCFDFVKGKLYESINTRYIENYNHRVTFERYHYELKFIETYAADELYSYLISASLKRSSVILSEYLDSIVFNKEMIIPPKLILKDKNNTVLLDEEGIPSRAKYSDERIQIEKIGESKFSV